MNPLFVRAFALALLVTATALPAQVPQLVNYQGRVAVDAANFDGSGAFKFALVNANGSVTYWSNSADIAPADGVPDTAVTLPVTKGLYSVLLGDTTRTNMTAIPATVWANADVRLRVWFNDGNPLHGTQLLTPDQRLAPNGYIPDSAITTAKIAPAAVGSAQLASGLTLSGTTTGTFSGNGAALTNVNTPSSSNYVFAYSDIIGVGTAGEPGVNFEPYINHLGNTAGGWTLQGSGLVVPATGVYLIQYEGNVGSYGEANPSLFVWSGSAWLFGTEIPGSQIGFSIWGHSDYGTPNIVRVSHTFIASLTTGSVLSFLGSSSTTGAAGILNIYPVGVGTTKTSFSVTIVRLQ